MGTEHAQPSPGELPHLLNHWLEEVVGVGPDAMVAVHTYEAEYASRVRQVEAARNATNLSWIRYEGGLTSYLEYLELQRALFSAELRASETLQLQLTSLVELYKALGGGWNPVEESP